ncbi:MULTISPECIES: 4-hydroxyphenylpyruvate dioxygenase family protein [Streptomyces]|uniref:4-hydroxyphenylpyruvate dioxygenase n=1 Tax=Streptomyces tsukubensis (strain DSM 42081 / NBRC 108919 / NRRL 18488 / 9993) TaxID=1114943 RepID=I2MTA9_STRT9|nr:MULTISPECIES: VOC family protein [Streptomyces]AZK92608.1 4-hydroxyphenylpyruvate dioxygenase [Streptomyces tsukubensis]EIF88006.1 4-hydroxyphenylpyruvate dioxygenase [Streptomyces tsukubensis NRRL18488]MYS64023.1 4-hydroxyphenylpyruvate dioxygenase [Streptomyces sp. SID5473]QKM71217.1 4-hydroxyphenylpyruvate dioxygenase [Streptomyces tsukubensis NRRL18488]TAI40381.1 4-hydroxyphenylpyruvate dioxygenase [Streptomyces tsukubensis]
MAVYDVAYTELYTSNKKSVVDYFVSALGFTREAEAVGVDRSSALLRQGTARLIVTTGPATWKFLGAHGDGIADIAFTCDDVTHTLRSARAVGATVTGSAQGRPAILGCGSLTHTLLSRRDGPGTPPPGRNWVPVPGAPGATPTGRIRHTDHIALCLEAATLGQYTDLYREALGLVRHSAGYVDAGEHGMDSVVLRSPSGRVTLALAAPDPRKQPGQLDAFLERNGGPGARYLSFLVDSIVPAVHEARDRGVVFLPVPDDYYDSLPERVPAVRTGLDGLRAARILADRDEPGTLLQALSRSPYGRSPLFHGLIERRGSRGLGPAHHRALYEAVERDRQAAE